MALGALLTPPPPLPELSVGLFPQIPHTDSQARELTRHMQPRRLKFWLSSSCDKTVSSTNQKGMHHILCSCFSTANTNQTVPWVEGITGLNVAVQKSHTSSTENSTTLKGRCVQRTKKRCRTMTLWCRRTAAWVHTHAHLNCTVYQPSGFHGYPLTCAHLHPKPIKRKYKDKRTMKWT